MTTYLGRFCPRCLEDALPDEFGACQWCGSTLLADTVNDSAGAPVSGLEQSLASARRTSLTADPIRTIDGAQGRSIEGSK